MSTPTKNNNNDNSQIEVHSATIADIPTLADIHVAAFQHDLAVQLMFTDAQQHQAVTAMLQAQIPSADSIIVKAVDTTSGDVLGWQGCVFMNDDIPSSASSGGGDSQSNENVTNLDKIADAGSQQGQNDDPTTTTTGNVSSIVNPALRTFISQDGEATRKTNMRKRGRFLLLNTLVVSPRHQHRGVGSTLVKWAAARVDREGIASWLQSSPVAAPVYAAAGGFRGVRDLDVDLSEYAPGGEGAGRGWGVYRFRYMLREPMADLVVK